MREREIEMADLELDSQESWVQEAKSLLEQLFACLVAVEDHEFLSAAEA
jgi:hypothetical protein